jgi:hypothetical protein
MVTILTLLAKFSISFANCGMYLITAENRPTPICNLISDKCLLMLRHVFNFFLGNSLFGFIQTVGDIGTTISPCVSLLGDYWYPLPFIIYGISSVISSALYMVFIKETKREKLPETIDEFL